MISSGCRKSETVARLPEILPIESRATLEVDAVSFNIRNENDGDRETKAWFARVKNAVRLIRRMAPDVMGMQELTHGQAADLRASLPDYEFFGIGRGDGKRNGEYAGIFFRHDRFIPDPQDGGTFWLSATPSKAGSATWGNTLPRIATWLRLVDRQSGRGFYVFNTHFDHRHQGSRERSALLIAERIDARRHPGEPVVLLGDFNAIESNPAVAYLAGQSTVLAGRQQRWKSGLIDVFQTIHPRQKNRQTLHFWTGSLEGGRKVDHILISKGGFIKSAEIATDEIPYASDHFPVTARIVFPPDE